MAKKLCTHDNGFLPAESTFVVEKCQRTQSAVPAAKNAAKASSIMR